MVADPALAAPRDTLRFAGFRRVLPWFFITLPLWSVAYLLIHLVQAHAYFGHIPQYLVDRDWFNTHVELFAHEAWFSFYLFASLLFIPWFIAALVLAIRRSRQRADYAYSILFLISAASFFSLVFLDRTGFIGWLID